MRNTFRWRCLRSAHRHSRRNAGSRIASRRGVRSGFLPLVAEFYKRRNCILWLKHRTTTTALSSTTRCQSARCLHTDIYLKLALSGYWDGSSLCISSPWGARQANARNYGDNYYVCPDAFRRRTAGGTDSAHIFALRADPMAMSL